MGRRLAATLLAFSMVCAEAQAGPVAARVLSAPVGAAQRVAPLSATFALPSSLSLGSLAAPALALTNLPELSIAPALAASAPGTAVSLARPAAFVSGTTPLSAQPAGRAAAPRAAVAKRVAALTQAIAGDSKTLAEAPLASARSDSKTSFDRLLGLNAGTSDASDSVAASARGRRRNPLGREIAAGNRADAPPAPKIASALKTYLAGTALFKLGMEAVGLGVPLIALTVFGQAKWAAMMAVGYGLSQVVFSSLAGGLLDRKSPTKVLAGAMALQALTVTAMIGLFAADLYFPGIAGIQLAQPALILALHALNGGFTGVSDTARQVIPPELVGNNHKQIKLFNAKTHVAYEISGVIGALAVGVILSIASPIAALLIHPPAYLLAAWVFSRIQMPAKAAAPESSFAAAASAVGVGEQSRTSPLAENAARGFALSQIWTDFKKGAHAIWRVKEFRWAAYAMVVPLVLHRLLEGLLIPVAANSLLGNPAAAAWMIGASNFGEMLGAILLIRAVKKAGDSGRFRSPFWIKWMALGLLGLWTLTFAPTLWALVPLVAFGSLTWAASDLSLKTRLQDGLPSRLRGRAFAFVGAAAFAIVLAASLGLGTLFDAVAAAPVFFGVNAVIAVLVATLFYAAKRLQAGDPADPKKDPA
ncbi:MAG: hypothetical protein AUJ52_00985 [Elusimicrobia bacterium CG1_02_63_36]|nr:MAG: hypothetical protein AUJ52_00985 [Elusimicrobia bacterium CG1_02_63_36]PIP84104.1 MAG: hypothetical protein COR54_05895 [Elusimicrobia bacterium CG22_combo_CG10-13_8_21_14_all_63_91]PJA14162.1 MAG: hypothetical protein COX66_13180 [Elusimicrobia bacterium CG_4_10_14_0_2_um_filter_63_34]PJB26793.1 MAG: hypothetical protein CO113_01700 [Elusimicrobia bacterium CG_4_9_14_3_um_filter_62_55]